MTGLSQFRRRDRNWHPPAYAPGYKSTIHRSPRRPLLLLPQSEGETTGPVFGHGALGELDSDLIRNYTTAGEAIGERIVIHGTVMDEYGRPVPDTLIEIWQANAGGRYRHLRDQYIAALDPNFGGGGRCITDAEGKYSFRTIKPGPYPFRNDGSEWRPSHIHFSIFGHAFAQRLVTQLYFQGDPLIPLCPIANTIPDQAAIDRLTAKLEMQRQIPFDSLVYRFDIVLRGRESTVFENRREGN